jgi:hypothetical protein
MSVLYANDLTSQEWQHLVAEFRWPSSERGYCWLEAPEGWALNHWPTDNGKVFWHQAGRLPEPKSLEEIIPRLTGGRLFSPAGELKWRCLPVLGGRCYRTVFLGDEALANRLTSLEPLPVLATLIPREARHPLWGQQTAQTPGEWLDLRIPHRFAYPVNAHPPPQGRYITYLTVELWCTCRGEIHFVRLYDLSVEQES